MTNLDSILIIRDITLPTKVHIVKAVVFPVVMYGCENWTTKKAEHQKTDAFKLCWRRLLRVPWRARGSNQSVLKEINPKYSLEGLMLEIKSNSLATWREDLTHWKRPWRWERVKVRGEGDNRGWDGWTVSPNQWTWVWVSSRRHRRTAKTGVVQFMASQSRARLSYWTMMSDAHKIKEIKDALFFLMRTLRIYSSNNIHIYNI